MISTLCLFHRSVRRNGHLSASPNQRTVYESGDRLRAVGDMDDSDDNDGPNRTRSMGSHDLHIYKEVRSTAPFERQMSIKSTPGKLTDLSSSPGGLSDKLQTGSATSTSRNLMAMASQMSLVEGSLLNEEGLMEAQEGVEEGEEKAEKDQMEKEKGGLVMEEEMEKGKVGLGNL